MYIKLKVEAESLLNHNMNELGKRRIRLQMWMNDNYNNYYLKI